jgi:hypothetical protein
MYFNNVKITEDSINKTRQWFYDNAMACIDEAVSGKVFVTELDSYINWQKQRAESALNGENDNTFVFIQRAYYIQTGESIALLPN